MAGWKSRKSKHGAGGRYAGLLDKVDKLLLCIAKLHTVPYKCQRLFCVINKLCSTAYGLCVYSGIRHIATYKVYTTRLILCERHLGILWKI